MFAFNEAGATIGVQSISTDSNYLNGLTNVEKSSFDISQAGFVLVLTNPSSKWDKIAFGFNTQTINNFDKNLFARGTNYNRGLEDYFLENASGISYDTFDFSNVDISFFSVTILIVIYESSPFSNAASVLGPTTPSIFNPASIPCSI